MHNQQIKNKDADQATTEVMRLSKQILEGNQTERPEMALHNVNQLIDMTGFSRTTIYKYIHTGELRALRFGERKYLITSEDLASFLKNQGGEQKW